MITIRIRSAVWFVTGLAFALVLAATWAAWRADAAPGDTDATFNPITPCRLFDYRPAPDTVGPRTAPLGPGEVATQQVTGAVGNCNVPAEATGVAMNVTIVGPTAQSNLRLWNSDAPEPLVSNLNWLPGQSPTPNKVDVKLSPTGEIKMKNLNGNVFVLADVVGYYTPSSLKTLQSEIDMVNSGVSTIPSGSTVTGVAAWDHVSVLDNADVNIYVQLPARAPAALSFINVNFAPNALAIDGDATCTGTVAAPTAPAGKVCIYVQNSVRVDTLRGLGLAANGLTPSDQAFAIRFNTNDAAPPQDMYLYVTWAYTAP